MAWKRESNGHIIEPENLKFNFLEKDENILIQKIPEQKIRYLLEKYKELEWAAALIGSKNNDGYVVKDIKLAEQEIGGTTVEFTDKGCTYIAQIPSVIGWIHSHNTMPANFFSGTDMETAEMFEISIVINNEFEYKAIKLHKIDCQHCNGFGKKTFKDLTLFLESNILPELQKQEIDAQCTELLKEKTYYLDNKKYDFNFPEKPSTQTILNKNLKVQPDISDFIEGYANPTQIGQEVEKLKKKLIRQFGKTWECPLCCEALGKNHKAIEYNIQQDAFIHKICRTIFKEEDEWVGKGGITPVQRDYYYGSGWD